MLMLSDTELSGLTGRSQPAAQIRWLKHRDWLFEISQDGLPKVACAYFERRLVSGENVKPNEAGTGTTIEWQVNTDALRSSFKN